MSTKTIVSVSPCSLVALSIKRSEFDYALPPERIAQAPVSPRDHSRLMVVHALDGTFEHQRFYEIGSHLRAGDVLVLNTTRVFPARLRGKKITGGKVDILLVRALADGRWQALARGAGMEGTQLVFPERLTARLEERLENSDWAVRFSQSDLRGYLSKHGEMPLPPYIKRPGKNPADEASYQTVYARREGSIAAPTAGFHFTPELLASLRARGIQIVEILLHVGWGTFRPIRVERIEQHRMLPETYDVPEAAAAQLNGARREGRRIIAVGTTAVRTLESVYDAGQESFRAGQGQTDLFIYPGYRFKAVDGLITNFHLPHSTPLLLACAFYGHKRASAHPFSLRDAYTEAVRNGYRFYSYGDAMFIL